MVGHALRILAFRYSYDLRRSFKSLLFSDLEVPDDIDCRLWSYQCKFVQVLVLEELVSNLDDALVAVKLACKVDTYCDLVFYTLEIKDVQCLTSGGQSIGASVSASVLAMNIQG